MAQSKRRGNGEGSIRKRPDGKWEGRYTNPEGKRKSVYGVTRTEVKNRLISVANDMLEGDYTEPSSMPLEHLIELYIKSKIKTCEEKTISTYCAWFDAFIRPRTIAKIPLTKLSHNHIQALVDALHSEGKSKATVTSVHGLINSALKMAMHPKRRYIKFNVAAGVEWPKFKEAKKQKAFTFGEEQRFIQAAKAHPLGNVFLLMLCTGIRPGEMMGLTWDNIDFANGIIEIRGNRQYLRIVDSDLKTKEFQHKDKNTTKSPSGIRDIPMLSGARTILNEMKSKTINMKYVCTNTYGQPITSANIVKAINEIETVAKVPLLSPHKLRHTFATRGLESDMQMRVVQELLGHATMGETADTYSHVQSKHKKEQMLKLDELMDGIL